MTLLDSPDTCPELYEFLDLFLSDEERGAVRSLEEYLRRFPGAEDRIAHEYLVQTGQISAPAPGQTGGAGAIPARIGDYELEAEIGRGGQGRVFRARDQRLPRQVAVKVLSAGLFPSSRAVDRFRREAEAASRLEHQGIGTVYDAGCQDGLHWIAMRWVDGKSVAEHLHAACSVENAHGPVILPEADTDERTSESTARKDHISAVLGFFADAADALHHAHEQGVTHRDIKPANIMVTEAGAPVILDFGLARDTEASGPTLTESGDLMGTPAYMSPEQLTIDRAPIPRTPNEALRCAERESRWGRNAASTHTSSSLTPSDWSSSRAVA
ncbi:MAG: hypothetical protein CMJ83_19225 [Planctomycetes bacterium]|nr:hypothetical protein [Planctomycetota bacterium]